MKTWPYPAARARAALFRYRGRASAQAVKHLSKRKRELIHRAVVVDWPGRAAPVRKVRDLVFRRWSTGSPL